MATLAVICGLVMLVAGGELLVSGAVKLAERLGMSSLLIGLTVVAFGTSIPELFVSLSAVSQDHGDIMLGNVVGSNIANIGLVLGFSALLSPLIVHFKKISRELYLLVGASFAVVGIGLIGIFNRLYGIIFFGVLLLYTYQAYRIGGNNQKTPENSGNAKVSSYIFVVSLCVTGLVILALGSNLFIDGAVDLARFFGISDLVIGLTMAAVGTSLPELASSVSALRRNEGDLLVGNVIGSNLFNLMMVLGICATFHPFALPGQTLIRDLPVMICFSAVLIPVIFFRHGLNRLHGAVLLLAYGGYMYSLL